MPLSNEIGRTSLESATNGIYIDSEILCFIYVCKYVKYAVS